MTDLKWAINLNRLMLKIIGLWPPDNRDMHDATRSKHWLLYNIIMFLLVLVIPTLMSLIRVWGDMLLVIDNLLYSLPLIIVIFKICIIWSKQKALLPLIDMIQRDWLKKKIKEERDVMLRYAWITRIIAMSGMFMIFCAFLGASILPCFGRTIRHVTNLTDPGKPLPIQTYYLFDVSKSPQFELTLLAQAIVIFVEGLSYTAVDNFLGLLVMHVCGQLENLHTRLSHMERYSNFNAALKYNVQDHIRLIRSIEIIDDTFNLMLLGMITYFGIVFCLQGFLLANVLKQEGNLPFMQFGWFVVLTSCILLHMCLYCAVGEILASQSERIHQAVYEYAWYTIKSKVAKDLILIMLNSDKPLHITAGKIFPMTMATLCNLIKTSGGYISVLLANQD